MDIQYYRKIKPREAFGNIVKRIWRWPLLRWSIIVGLPFLLFVTFSTKGLLQRVRLESEKRLWQQKVQEAAVEQKRLQQLSKSLDAENASAGAVERIAREKYGMVKEGETVYKLKKDK